MSAPLWSKRPSAEARYQLIAQAGVSSAVKDIDRTSVEADVADYFLARARREFVRACWVDEARYPELVAS